MGMVLNVLPSRVLSVMITVMRALLLRSHMKLSHSPIDVHSLWNEERVFIISSLFS